MTDVVLLRSDLDPDDAHLVFDVARHARPYCGNSVTYRDPRLDPHTPTRSR